MAVFLYVRRVRSLRVMAEGPDKADLDLYVNQIVEVVQRELV